MTSRDLSRRHARFLRFERLEPRLALAAKFGFALGLPVGDDFGVGAQALAVDSQGDVILAGYFNGTVDFTPSVAGGDLAAAGRTDGFIAKYTAAGDLLWARRFGGEDYDLVNDMACDDAGNIYLAGRFLGTADFDPSDAVVLHSSPSQFMGYALKLTSAGEFSWVRMLTGEGYTEPTALAVNRDGTVALTGVFDGTVDLDPGTQASQTAIQTSRGDLDVFVTRWDTTGAFLWGTSIGSPDAEFAADVAIDAVGDIVVAGDYKGTIAAWALTSAGERDVFVAKYRQAGDSWNASLGGTGNELASAVTLDAAGNVYVTGSFQKMADFDPAETQFFLTAADTNDFGSDVFVGRLSESGEFRWAARLGNNNPLSESSSDIAALPSGSVVVTGGLAGAAQDSDVFLAEFHAGGGPVWQTLLAGPDGETGRAVALDGAASVYTAGDFAATTDFDPGPASFTVPAPGSGGVTRMFLSKLTQSRIGDLVWHDKNQNGVQDIGEPGLEGVLVELFDTVDGIAGNGNDVSRGTCPSDSEGRFVFEDVAAGQYYLTFQTPSGYAVTSAHRGTRRDLDSDLDRATGRTEVFSIAANTGDTTRDAGFFAQGDFPWHNSILPQNVDADVKNLVTPLDALLVINRLNSGGSGPLPVPPTSEQFPPPYYDVSKDNLVTPLDALMVINYINNGGASGEAEGEARLLPESTVASTSRPAALTAPRLAVSNTGRFPDRAVLAHSPAVTETLPAVLRPAMSLPNDTTARPPVTARKPDDVVLQRRESGGLEHEELFPDPLRDLVSLLAVDHLRRLRPQ